MAQWLFLLALLAGMTAAQWAVGGWALVLGGWLQLFVLFGPTTIAVRCGWRSLGKRPDGGRAWWATAIFAPYLLATRFAFGLARMSSREEPFVVIVPNVALGRRLTVREARRTQFTSVLDLACEFSEVRPFRALPGYVSVPVFDTTAPTPEQLRFTVEWLKEAVTRGPVYVHCALGHGRSACVVLAHLLAVGKVSTVQDGLSLIRERRPKVRLHPGQRESLRPFEAIPRPT